MAPHGPSYTPAGGVIRWLRGGSPRRDDGIDIAEEVDQCVARNAAPISDRFSASGRPVLRAIQRATG